MASFNSFLYVYQRVNFLSPNRVFFEDFPPPIDSNKATTRIWSETYGLSG